MAYLFVLFTGAVIFAVQPASAQVPTCEALTLYGNAVNQGLCKSLSPGAQNLWVCALTNTDPDIHTTFNAATALHVTVRTPPGIPTCQGNSTLAGNWPGALAIQGGQPNAVCNVNIPNYVRRLNAVPRMAQNGGQSFCRTAFLAAGANLKISQAVMASYLTLCNNNACP
ncbi:MAG: hypothetical protein GY859_07040 [Desulfobacterales bacterium]|nr:hypothetical protein [Desulfobacterales bacterium]